MYDVIHYCSEGHPMIQWQTDPSIPRDCPLCSALKRAKSLESQLAGSQYNYERLEATCDEHFKTIIMLKQHRHEAGCQIAARDSVIRELQAQLKAAGTGPTEKDVTIGCLNIRLSQQADEIKAQKASIASLESQVQGINDQANKFRSTITSALGLNWAADISTIVRAVRSAGNTNQAHVRSLEQFKVWAENKIREYENETSSLRNKLAEFHSRHVYVELEDQVKTLTDQLAAEKLKVLKLGNAVGKGHDAMRALSTNAIRYSSEITKAWGEFAEAIKEAQHG